MNKLLGFVALGVGGFILYEYFKGTQQSTGTTNTSTTNTTTTTTTTGSGVTNPLVTSLPVYVIPDLRAKILNVANVDATKQYNAHQWSYYYAQVSGVGPVDARFGTAFGDGFGLYTIDEYMAKLKANGLAGTGFRGFTPYGATKYEAARKIMQ